METHLGVRYLNIFSGLTRGCAFVFGDSSRGALGVDSAVGDIDNQGPEYEVLDSNVLCAVPSPLLGLDKHVITKVAVGESHSLFLSDRGRLLVCGSSFSGLLGLDLGTAPTQLAANFSS